MTEASGTLRVAPVASPREREIFLRLPWRIHAAHPLWVPPLLSSARRTLDPAHPFFRHAEAELILAWRGERPVGRIAAIVNRLHNDRHGDRLGFFGFFEAERDPEAFRALLAAAARWLQARGMAALRGPMNPSINGESGVLVEGYERPPVVMMPWNPPWYPELLAAAGLRPAKDLLGFRLTQEDMVPGRREVARMERLADAVRRRHPEIVVRGLDMGRFQADAAGLNELFNAARAHNWGFVPVTEAEFALMIREMRPIFDPRLVVLAEVAGELAGCMLAIPDINPLLKKCKGSLWPWGWAFFLLGRRRLTNLRVFGAAVLPRYRNLGVGSLLFVQLIRNFRATGYTEADLSWIAEDNHQSRHLLEGALAAGPYKRFRIFEAELDGLARFPAAPPAPVRG